MISKVRSVGKCLKALEQVGRHLPHLLPTRTLRHRGGETSLVPVDASAPVGDGRRESRCLAPHVRIAAVEGFQHHRAVLFTGRGRAWRVFLGGWRGGGWRGRGDLSTKTRQTGQ